MSASCQVISGMRSRHIASIAARLTERALDWFRAQGMSIAMVETGGDPGHAPARRAYEASGFQLLPVARYFKAP